MPPEKRSDQVARGGLVGDGNLSKTVGSYKHHELEVGCVAQVPVLMIRDGAWEGRPAIPTPRSQANRSRADGTFQECLAFVQTVSYVT